MSLLSWVQQSGTNLSGVHFASNNISVALSRPCISISFWSVDYLNNGKKSSFKMANLIISWFGPSPMLGENIV